MKITNFSICKCGHRFWKHHDLPGDGQTFFTPGMNKRCADTISRDGASWFCHCLAFEMDNLLYLEEVLHERQKDQ